MFVGLTPPTIPPISSGASRDLNRRALGCQQGVRGLRIGTVAYIGHTRIGWGLE